MAEINLTIDGVEVRVNKGATVLQAAQSAGIYIPSLCSHPDLPSSREVKADEFVYRGTELIKNDHSLAEFEGCQLCIVDIGGMDGLPTACTTEVAEGMVVQTNTPQVLEKRRDNLVLLITTHPHYCLTCPNREGCIPFEPVCPQNVKMDERCCAKLNHCEVQKVAEYIGIREDIPRYIFRNLPIINDEPLFDRDYNLCLGCTRCIRVCKEVRGVDALGFVFQDGKVIVGTKAPTLRQSGCKFCGACVEVCPTGALIDRDIKLAEREAKLVPCRSACPAGVDVPRYVHLIAEGKYDQALAVIREKLPLPSVCSYVCLRFCEAKCRRGEVSEPMAIMSLKRFVSDNHSELWKEGLKAPSPNRKKVAIVGSGPTGLTAGYYLTRCGHQVTIFEASSAPGGMLRDAISKKRLPREALRRDIDDILQMGVNLQLNSRRTSVDELFADGFDAVLLAVGSTYVGVPAFRSGEEGLRLTPWGSIAVEPGTLATSRKGVFAGGDVVLGGISEDFIQYMAEHEDEVSGEKGLQFIDILIEQVALHRGDASRSVTRAVAAGRQAASSINRYLGGSGEIDEALVAAEAVSPWLGRNEGFADLGCLAEPYRPPPPQFAGLGKIEPPLDEKAAVGEAKRCLRCDLRLEISPVILPPEKWLAFNAENVSAVPEKDGVFQLVDEQKMIIYIKGTANLRQELESELATREKASYFDYEENFMYTGRESELLQKFLQEHGRLPEGNEELEELF